MVIFGTDVMIGVAVVIVVGIAIIKQVYLKWLVTKKAIENDALVFHYRR